jgi:SAM-dependent methyltransferase
MSDVHLHAGGICPVCEAANVQAFVHIGRLPVNANILWPTREQAVGAPRGPIGLGFCGRCGHVFNMQFDPPLIEYDQDYENSLHFSPLFHDYARSLAAHLVERYDLHGKDIVEIGCGKGEFLHMLCELGQNRGVGFDPSYLPEPNAADAGRVTFVQDYYSERYGGYRADLICCQQVLEHIPAPRELLAILRRAIGERRDTAVFFEVPNVGYTLSRLAIWDIIYEHCSYYSAASLAYLFAVHGFEVRDLVETFGGQFLAIEALPRDVAAPPCSQEIAHMARDVAAFAENYRQTIAAWRQRLDHLARSGRRAVVWGAGAKGVTFLNTLAIDKQIDYVVDMNPRKQDMYITGTGQRIVAPEFLRDERPDVVIVMNPIYEKEIQKIIAGLGLDVEYISV